MSTTSIFQSSRTILFLGVSGVISLFIGWKAHTNLEQIRAQNDELASNIAQTQRVASRIDQRLAVTAKAHAVGLPIAMASAVRTLYASAQANNVKILDFALKKASVSNVTSIQNLSVPVPEVDGLRGAQVLVKGNYGDFSGMKSFLARVRQMPVSLDGLKISGRGFEALLTIYGT